MSDLEKLLKIINTYVKKYESDTNSRDKEISSIKNILTKIERRVSEISRKIQEFEIILDASEIIEDQEIHNDEFDPGWNPYESESYENYEDDAENFD